jgi:O-antigen/teichoic acid export membrane protein
VTTFGVYGLAVSIVALSGVVANFGMAAAFVHRAPETEDEGHAAAVYFTLKLVFASVWAGLMAIGTLVLASGELKTALLVLTATGFGVHMVQTPRVILGRRIVHRRMALVQITSLVASSAVAVGLAYQGATLWALLAVNLVSLLIGFTAFYVWRPVWRPRLVWAPDTMRYYLRFGSRNFVADALSLALDRIDDVWTGVFLGDAAMGYYSRAYAFAIYPRRILASPIYAVSGGTFAELKTDRLRLSQAFFRVNAFLVRSGFLLAGVLALIAPELIRLALGAKWLPMLETFRLMLVFTLLDPIKGSISGVFVAVGQPQRIAGARTVQMVVLVAGLFLLGPQFGIAGVAVAVNLMLVAGIALLLWQARAHVDFSATRLFVAPTLSLVAGLVAGSQAARLPWVAGSDWRTGLAKAVIFAVVYGAILLALEHRDLTKTVRFVRYRLSQGRKKGEPPHELDAGLDIQA